MREHRLLGQLQNRDRVLATHRRKVLQEMIQRIPFFEVVEKRCTGTRVPANTTAPL